MENNENNSKNENIRGKQMVVNFHKTTPGLNIYYCSICHKLILLLDDSKTDTICCGQKMEKLESNYLELGGEKHLPVLSKDGDKTWVSVGEVLHPMYVNHYIMWIILETKDEIFIRYLKPEETPKICFNVNIKDVISAYAYCNVHGLWETDM